LTRGKEVYPTAEGTAWHRQPMRRPTRRMGMAMEDGTGDGGDEEMQLDGRGPDGRTSGPQGAGE